MNNKYLLNLIDITVSFEGFLALNKLNLNLKKGELRAVIGPNGAGKTTFLDVITGKVKPTKGEVIFKGKSLVGRNCLLYTSPSPRDLSTSRMPSSA